MSINTDLKNQVSDSFGSLFWALPFPFGKTKSETIIENDVWINCSDKLSVPAHWFVLRTRCEYFESCWKFKQSQGFDMKIIDGIDFDSSTWFDFLRFIYCGEFELNENNKFKLLYMAHYFLMNEFKDRIQVSIIRQGPDTMEILFDYIDQSIECNCLRLFDACNQFVRENIDYYLNNTDLLKNVKKRVIFKIGHKKLYEKWKELVQSDETMSEIVASNISYHTALINFNSKFTYCIDLEQKKVYDTPIHTLDYIPHSFAKINQNIYIIGTRGIYDQNKKICSNQHGHFESFATCCCEQNIFIAGGSPLADQKAITKQVSKFDVQSEEWKECALMKQERKWFTLNECNKELYAIGGSDCKTKLSTVEIYNIYNNEWRQGPQLSLSSHSHSSTTFDQNIFVVGGWKNAMVMLDTREGKWQNKQSMNHIRSHFGLLEWKGDLLAFCGYVSHNSVERYDIRMNKWEIWIEGTGVINGDCQELVTLYQ